MIVDGDNKLCYATKAECKRYISSDKLRCISYCDAEAKETGISMDNGEYF